MKRKSQSLLTSVKQQWTAYGACRWPVVAAKIKLDAEESTRALAKYIEELEAQTPKVRKT